MQSQAHLDSLDDTAQHLAHQHQNVKVETFYGRMKNSNETEENAEEQNADSEESSNGAALHESGSKRSLRRTTRVKTAKNNSEFIYFGKYNKELMKPRSYSKSY